MVKWFTSCLQRLFGKKQVARGLLVHTFTEPRTIASQAKVNFYVHLYETQTGERSVTVSCSRSDYNPKEHLSALHIYNSTVRAWLSGRYFPEIPSYNQAEQEDVVKALSQ